MKRCKPLKRGRRVKPVNGARKAHAFARNFGPEADALRWFACVVASRGDGNHRCSRGPVDVAHVVARGMGGAKGGRFDVVPMCSKAHRNAGEARTTMREAFELLFGVDLRAEADRIAFGHERPLGIKGLADRWVQAQIGSGSLSEVVDWQLDAYETDALRGWISREMAREVKRRETACRRGEYWLRHLGVEGRRDTAALGLVQHEMRSRGVKVWDGLPPNDREALSNHIAGLLGGPFLEDPHGEHGLAWSLCEWATERVARHATPGASAISLGVPLRGFFCGSPG